MSRKMLHRWELTGELVAESAIHVGGLGDGPPQLVQARDGLGRLVLPGSSLAGVIRAALAGGGGELWGVLSGRDQHGRDDGTGMASWVRVDDAIQTAEITPEVRESVSIDRVHGVAAHGHLFTREVLPAGSRFTFRMVVDDRGDAAAETLIDEVAALLRGPGITVGAAISRGLGRVRLEHTALRRYDLATRAGMIATLRGEGVRVDLPEPTRPETPARGMLRVEIPWRPRGPLSVQVSADGDVVDAFPLSTRAGDVVRLELPGSTIKGVLRSHAERIVRTVTRVDAPAEPTRTPGGPANPFLAQLRADGLGPVGSLFGTAGDRDSGGQAAGRRGALRVNTCVSATALPARQWAAVRLLQRRAQDPPPVGNARGLEGNGGGANRPAERNAEKQAALGRLALAVDELNKKVKGIQFVIAQHVAVDRWTGGAAEGLLYATLEPHSDEGAWPPMVLELDTDWLGADSGQPGDAEQRQRAALALLLLVLRDLCDGWLAFGHGTTRGMGAVTVDPDRVRFRTGPEVADWLTALDDTSLADLLDHDLLTKELMAAWLTAIDPQSAAIPVGSGQ